ncbi:anti-sigma factor antagonist [Lentzea sp. NBRC 105346]|uniref:STAS domain-containing protein n=1 Tax=Lentzea sp. NBRC 105346 TaxID=3032205 RepID=UPI0024A46107|nr:STAS domain-containing protein [Lentzea sp. NBRC 105346]GLZ27962.1 anti-sigma factor antagonist [Lentzea sp. NBRC 105346]
MQEQLSGCSVRTVHCDGVPVVSVAGEVDIGTVRPLVAELTAQLNRSPAALVVDLRAVSFFDSSGVNGLLTSHHLAVDRRVELHVVVVRPIVRRTLQITGLDELFRLHATVPEALRAIRPLPVPGLTRPQRTGRVR